MTLHMDDARPPAPTPLLIPPGLWGHKKMKLKNKYAVLSEDDLAFVPGGEEALSLRLQQRLNMGVEDLHTMINAL